MFLLCFDRNVQFFVQKLPGWHQADLIERLESQRKVKSKKYYVAKKAKKLKELQTVQKNAKSLDTETLKAFGGIHPTFLA